MKKKKTNQIKEDSKVLRIFLIVVLILVIAVSIYPFVYMVLISFMESYSMKLTADRLMEATWTFKNYEKLLTQADFLTYFKNSTIVTVYAVVMNCLCSSMAAYAFAKKKFPGSNGLFLLFLATMMVPYQVTLIPVFLILKNLHMLNTFSAIALPSCGAFGVLLVHQFAKSLPNDLLEAADIDGCGEVRKFVQIVFPLLKPAIISLAIFTFIDVWGNLILPLIMNTKNERITLTVAIANLKTTRKTTDYGFMMAASTVSFLPPFILYLFLQKQFVEGIALSGTKM